MSRNTTKILICFVFLAAVGLGANSCDRLRQDACESWKTQYEYLVNHPGNHDRKARLLGKMAQCRQEGRY